MRLLFRRRPVKAAPSPDRNLQPCRDPRAPELRGFEPLTPSLRTPSIRAGGCHPPPWLADLRRASVNQQLGTHRDTLPTFAADRPRLWARRMLRALARLGRGGNAHRAVLGTREGRDPAFGVVAAFAPVDDGDGPLPIPVGSDRVGADDLGALAAGG
jgi:hypothetical protein